MRRDFIKINDKCLRLSAITFYQVHADSKAITIRQFSVEEYYYIEDEHEFKKVVEYLHFFLPFADPANDRRE